MKVVPTNDNVLVKRDEAEEKKTPGGIHIPKSAQKTPVFCTVIAVGDMIDHSMTPIVAGSKVIVSTFAGTEIEIDDESFIMVKSDDILGVVADEKEKVAQ
jgi:chaperonin GroES